jgi:hypothetical protein
MASASVATLPAGWPFYVHPHKTESGPRTNTARRGRCGHASAPEGKRPPHSLQGVGRFCGRSAPARLKAPGAAGVASLLPASAQEPFVARRTRAIWAPGIRIVSVRPLNENVTTSRPGSSITRCSHRPGRRSALEMLLSSIRGRKNEALTKFPRQRRVLVIGTERALITPTPLGFSISHPHARSVGWPPDRAELLSRSGRRP